MDISNAIVTAISYLVMFGLMCGVYAISKVTAKQSSRPDWLLYIGAAFWSAVIAFVLYTLNDGGTIEECYDGDPAFGGGDCYFVEEYEVNEDERREKAGAIFLTIFLLSAYGISESHKQNFLSEMEKAMDNA